MIEVEKDVMDDINAQNIKFSDDDEVQITDLDAPDSSRQRRIAQIISALKIPWIRYSLTGTLILILLGSFFLQWRQSTPAISDVIGTQAPNFFNATTTQEMVFIQDIDHVLTAYQASTGRVQWQTQLPSTATIDAEGQVLYCYFTISPNKTGMKALNTNSGQVIWQNNDLPESPSLLTMSSLASSSAISRQIEMQKTSSIPGPTFLYNNNTLYIQNANNMIDAIQATTGRFNWVSQVPSKHYLVIDGETLYALAPPTVPTIQAFDLSDGRPLWTYSLPQGTWAQSEMDGVVYLYAARGMTLIALRGSDGHKLWSYSASDGQPMITSLTAPDGIEYLLQQDGTLVSIRISDGFVLWHAPLTMLQKPISSTMELLVDHDNILLYDSQPGVATSVYVLQASNGQLRWSTPEHIVNPVPLDSVLYTMHDDGQLDAWRESDGHHIWSYSAPPGARVVQDTYRDSSLLFLLDNAGIFYTLNTSDGKLLWSSQ